MRARHPACHPWSRGCPIVYAGRCVGEDNRDEVGEAQQVLVVIQVQEVGTEVIGHYILCALQRTPLALMRTQLTSCYEVPFPPESPLQKRSTTRVQ